MDIETHTFNPSTQESESQGSLWETSLVSIATLGQLGLYSENLSQNKQVGNVLTFVI